MPRLLQHAYWLGLWAFMMAVLLVAACFLSPLSGAQQLIELTVAGVLTLSTAWLVFHSLRIYPTRAGLMPYALLVAVLGGILLFTLDMYVANWLNQRLGAGPILRFKAFRFAAALLFTGWLAFQCAYAQRHKEITALLQQQQSAASLHREAALYKLRQQLQPHFLYNSLNSINALISLEPQAAQRMVVKLSDFLRHAVKQEGQEQITLADELAHIQNYLDIELVRFGHRLQVAVENNAPGTAILPPLLLQPLLENAIKYGLYGISETVTITIQIHQQDDLLLFQITNPFTPGQESGGGTGFGLQGLQQRLQLLFGRADLLHISKTENLFTATLKIPQA